MEDVPVMISKDLNLNVLGPANIALEENGIVAKRCRRLLPRFGNLRLKLAFSSNDPHPTPPSAERRLNDQRKSNLGGHSPGYGRVRHRFIGARNHWHACLLGEAPRSGLVAEQLEKIGRRTDEGDSRLSACVWQLWIFGEKAVTRMDGVNTLLMRQRDDARDVQIRLNRSLPFADQVSLIRLESMET